MTTPSIDSFVRSQRIENLKKMLPSMRSLLSNKELKENDSILSFFRMVKDVADDASYFMDQFKKVSWDNYKKTLQLSSNITLTNTPIVEIDDDPIGPVSDMSDEEKETPPPKSKKPRKGRNAQTIFVAENRKKIKSLPENKEKKAKEITQILKDMWAKMDEEAKKPCQTIADKEEAEYKEKMKDYTPPPKVKKTRKAKKVKDPNAPKKSMSAYQFFGLKVRADLKKSNEGKSKEDQKKSPSMKDLGDLWKQVSAEDRKPFEEQAMKAKEEWRKKVAIYKEAKKVKETENAIDAAAKKAGFTEEDIKMFAEAGQKMMAGQ